MSNFVHERSGVEQEQNQEITNPLLINSENNEQQHNQFESTIITIDDGSDDEIHDVQELTCEICFKPISEPVNTFNVCLHHPFCTDCLIKYIQVKLKDDNVGTIKCPGTTCHGHFLNPLEWAPVIGPELFVRWCDVLCQAAVLDSDNSYCPYRNCNELILNECGGKPEKSLCPRCKHWMCFQCKRVWHAKSRCEEGRVFYRDDDDVELGLLAEEEKWMRCPKCRYLVQRTVGCVIITCRCGKKFCYKCGEKVLSHDHSCNTAANTVAANFADLTPTQKLIVCILCGVCALFYLLIIYLGVSIIRN